MVRCLCYLHNWLIENNQTAILLSTVSNRFNVSTCGGRNNNSDNLTGILNIKLNCLNGFLDAYQHMDDTTSHDWYNHR